MIPDRTAHLALRTPDGADRTPQEVHDAVEAARVAGRLDLLVDGPEPTASRALLGALRQARDAGLRPVVVTDGRALATARRLDALLEAGCVGLRVVLPAPDDADPHATACLDALGGHALDGALLVRLDAAEAARVRAWVDRAARHAVRLLLAPVTEAAEGRAAVHAGPAVVQAVDAAWRHAAEVGVLLEVEGLSVVPAPVEADLLPPTVDRAFVEAWDRGVLPPSASTGVRLVGPALPDVLERSGSLRQTALGLAAAGVGAVDLPACLGGRDAGELPRARQPGCAPCPRGDVCPGPPEATAALDDTHPPPAWEGLAGARRVVILVPWHNDQLLVASTLPALAEALRGRGVDAEVRGPWDLPFQTDDLRARPQVGAARRAWWFAVRTITRGPDRLATYTPPPDRLGHPFRWAEDPARAAALDEAWWRELDLSDADALIVPGWTAARRAWEHPTRRPDATLVVADLHMLEGCAAWAEARMPDGGEAKTGAWWPEGRLLVHACFPRFQTLYRGLGVPLERVVWRPFPVHLGHVPAGPEPATCEAILAAGRHARDFATLRAAVAQVQGALHPVRVHAEPADTGPAAPGWEPLGMAELPDLVDAIRQCRFVVVPLLPGVATAAGISIAALALAAGRPVLASRTPAMLDHVRHGHDGLLVEPGDPQALAEALRALDTDGALLARLAAGAREAGRRLSVEAWASELLHGSAGPAPVPAPGANGGTRYAW
ncbi:MAG: glycosyltransferase [Alphaproteobacteria bacterium]|nr:glycosyltransferase [Alphaproteobacteria bacterium]